ncbi:MAG: hypothetical protein ACXQTJ_05420, partial [Candidatus Syntropharchaeales archaeon]
MANYRRISMIYSHLNNLIEVKNAAVYSQKFDFKYPQPTDGLRQTEREEDKIHREAQAEGKDREIAFEMRVSVSTVKRVWSYWLTHGEYLPIRKRGRKVKELSEKEK